MQNLLLLLFLRIGVQKFDIYINHMIFFMQIN